jgi:putative FmdB family regulatory protein
MPLYEYRCQSCGEKEEKLESFSSPTEHDCPRCGRPKAMRRQVSLTSFTLAGGGWYGQGYSAGRGTGTEGPSSPAKPASTSTEPASGGGCAGGCACHSGK